MNIVGRTRLALACAAALSLVLVSGAQPGTSGQPVANGKVAFVSDRDGSREIYTMKLDGSEQTRVTDVHLTQTGIPATPTWSPDGRIAFATYVGRWEIYAMRADGTQVVSLTQNDGASNYSPSWSPDGAQILFRHAVGGTSQIWVMNADGSGQTALTTGSVSDFDPVWSPDGTKIGFDRVEHGNSDIWVMNPDGSDPTDVTNDPLTEFQPSWSPDGRIAFVRRTGPNTDIWAMNADGSNQVRLTTDPADDLRPAWSPEGQYIYFVSNRDNQDEIYGMNADGTSQVDLTDSMASDVDPAWQTLPGPPSHLGVQPHLISAHGSVTVNPNDCVGPGRVLKGTPGNDRLVGTRPDTICGLGGNDVIYARGGNDVIYPGPGKDTIYTGPGDDIIFAAGDGSKDVISCGTGLDSGTYDPQLDVLHGCAADPDR